MTNTGSDDITLIDFIKVIFQEWRMVLAITASFAIVSIVVSLLMQEKFRAEATVIEARQRGPASSAAAMLSQYSGLSSMVGIDLGALRGDTGNALVLLHSRSLISEFIESNDLLKVLFDSQWDGDAQRWIGDADDVPTIWHGVRYFQTSILNIREEVTTGVLTLSVDWTDPEIAAEWANGLVTLANEISRQRDLSEARRNMEYLNARIAETNVVELQRVLYGLVESEMRTIMLAEIQDEYAFKLVDRAVAPEIRQSPRRKQIVILATILGGFIAALAVLIKCIVRIQGTGADIRISN